jgi:F-type H+-transporting ATPase subunit gamma
MSTLKELRVRIKSVRSTQKITSAMKMVAAAKFRKAHECVENGRPYIHTFQTTIGRLMHACDTTDEHIPLLHGNDGAPPLFVVIGTERGLCGGFNASVLKTARSIFKPLIEKKEHFYIIPIGKKIRDGLKKEYQPYFFDDAEDDRGHSLVDYARRITETLIDGLYSKAIGSVHMVHGILKNIMSQPIYSQQIIPYHGERTEVNLSSDTLFEPKAEQLIPQLLKHYVLVYVYQAFLENNACEQAARMTAMDSATRNADDMIHDLQLRYNQGRQAHITNELIEIISGAQAL